MSDYFSLDVPKNPDPLLTPSQILDQPLITASDLITSCEENEIHAGQGPTQQDNNDHPQNQYDPNERRSSVPNVRYNPLMYGADSSLPNLSEGGNSYQQHARNSSLPQSTFNYSLNNGSSTLTPQFNADMNLNSTEPSLFKDLATESMSLNTSALIDKMNYTNNAVSKENKDYILPRSHRSSPFYTTVPIPKPVKISENDSVSGSEGYAEDEIYDESNHFVKEYPTVLLADRFYKWGKILKALCFYLKEVAYSQEEFARINTQLKDSVKFKFLTDLDETTNSFVDPLTTKQLTKKQQPITLAEQKKLKNPNAKAVEYVEVPGSASAATGSSAALINHDFNSALAASGFMKFGSGSVQDLQIILKKYHLSQASQQYKISKEITTNIIPKLLDLRKDLKIKVRDIKQLHDNFKTNISDHITITSQLLHKYIAACKVVQSPKYNTRVQKIKPKHDPFLLKLQLDLQLKRQLKEENYLREAFINIQTAGLKLRKIVYSKIQDTLQSYSILIGSEAQLMLKNLCQELHTGICSNPPAVEWDQFVACHTKGLMNWSSVDPIPSERQVSDIDYPRRKSPLGKCVKSGYLKFKKDDLKVSDGYFVLTANFLHEFKSSNLYKSGNHSTTTSLQSQKNTKAATPKSSKSSKNKAQTGNLPNAIPTTSKKKTLSPNFSIPLDLCTLVESTDRKLVLRAPSIVPETVEVATHASEKTHILPSDIHLEHGKISGNFAPHISKDKKSGKASGFAKFLRGPTHHKNKSSSSSKTQQQQAKVAAQHAANVSLEPRLWTFTLEEDVPTAQDLKYFRKWVTDIKRLLSFKNVAERAEFIEECSIKNRAGLPHPMLSRSSSTGFVHSNSSSIPDFNDPSKAYINSVTQSSLNIPDSRNASSGHVDNSFLMSPMLDDKGNLISPNRPSSIIQSIQNASISSRVPQQFQLDSSVLKTKRSTPNFSSVTPNRQPSDDSNGGYFALPLSHQRSISNPTSPPYLERLEKKISGASSISNMNVSSNSSAIIPNFKSINSNSVPVSAESGNEDVNRIPAMKVNDQHVPLHPPNFQRSTSASSLPTSKATGENEPSSTGLYKNSNTSGHSLSAIPSAAATSRVANTRKHKKNVSFSSLSSLKFSKRSSTALGPFYNEQMMHNGIEEHDDDDADHIPHTGKTVKLSQSLYS
ncbi:hypothetical protein TPHA_0D02960 [Tetrapisispora phaffii CBS 4417]|uniref:PH domain-containing protein n=1 Tax=Tetrapisispora phaffii (strain ATCC 24235 / CBS 4417 / NBRC 1672 / NRRL Y-8282 / UCD 70-5) TaxID=1071381 RepID=G8BSW1_TETPH|nr:hypothetical protein TPHA_0D02960 [Tetrapisispora phaffii CBS 4417]CCE62932.1 hypothetical protein TPHA_0D02960 [Tetrapisispora phaffii CBS 4417]